MENRGTVMAGLNNAKVSIVDVPAHGYEGRDILSQAIDAASQRYAGKTLHYANHGVEFDYEIRPRSLKYAANHSGKSDSAGVHAAVMDMLNEVIGESIEVMEHADVHKYEGKRSEDFGYNEDALMHRFVGAVNIDGKLYRVVTTMKEQRKGAAKHHTYEVTKIEVLNAKAPSTSNATTNSGEIRLGIANLLKGAEIHNKSGEKILQESRVADEMMHQQEMAQTSVEAKSGHAEKLSKKFNTPIRIATDPTELTHDNPEMQRRMRESKGFYNWASGEVVVVVANNATVEDVAETVFHEVVAHKGLRELIGEDNYDAFCDEVYEHLKDDLKHQIDEETARRFMGDPGKGYEHHRRTAVDEMFGRMSEKGFEDFTKAERGIWAKLKEKVLEAINKFLGTMRLPKWVKLGDNELRYMLWRSHERLTGKGDYVDMARDAAKREELGLTDNSPLRETAAERELRQVNARFNEQLEQLSKEEKTGGELKLGSPGAVLRSAGIKGNKITLDVDVLKKKMNESYKHEHPFTFEDIKNLPNSINSPIAVFASGGHGDFNILVELKRDGKNFIASLKARTKATRGGNVIVDEIVTLYPKGEKGVINWINTGLGRYIDKEKALEWLTRREPHAHKYTIQELEDAAKVVKNFENPTIEDELLFRSGGSFTPRDRAMVRDIYERRISSTGFQVREAMLDSMASLEELYKAILGKKIKVEDVKDYENAYLAENAMSSENKAQQHLYTLNYLNPMLEEIWKIAGSQKGARQELTDYMMAKHGLERNTVMRAKAIADKEDSERDFAGLCGLTGKDDWQEAEDAAQKMVDSYEAMHNVSELWSKVNAATRATLDKLYQSGLLSNEMYQEIEGMYQWYIPLRGWDEKTSEQEYGYLTSPTGPLNGNVMKKAEGRSSKADDPIATIAMMADEAIRQGNRNRMKQRFLNFVLNNPSDLVSVNDMWVAWDDVNGEWVPQFPEFKGCVTAEDYESEIEDFETKMELLSSSSPDKYKRSRDVIDVPYKVVRGNMDEHQVIVERGGRKYVLTINGNPRAAQALNGLTNPDVDSSGAVGKLLNVGKWINRQLSTAYTTRNPDFVVSNFIRDALLSNTMTWVKESPRYAMKFHKNFLRALADIHWLMSKWESGTLDVSNRGQKLFYDFMANGGETGYTSIKDIEGHKKTIAAELKKRGDVGLRVWRALGQMLELVNRGVENCARYAAFRTSREMGRSIGRSVYDAKEVSVNFNKKGSGDKMLGAQGQTTGGNIASFISGVGRIGYVFWNAALQGTFRNYGKAIKDHPYKGMSSIAALMTLGFMVPLLNKMMGGEDEDENGEGYYYNLPEHTRRSNACIKCGDMWITIPLPIEQRAMYGLGELMYGVVSGKERYSDEEMSFQLASQMSQLMPIDVLEGGGGLVAFTPSLLKPVTEAYIMNKSWTGLPIYRDNGFNEEDPEWRKAYINANRYLVEASRGLNELSGGDIYTKGRIDINPAKIEYLLNGYLGGMFTFPDKLIKSGETALGKREFDWRNIPIANRVVKEGDERTANRKLQNELAGYAQEHERTGRRLNGYMREEKDDLVGYAEKVAFMFGSPEYLRYEIYEEYKPTLEAYKKVLKSGELSEEEKRQYSQDKLDVEKELVVALRDPEGYYKSRGIDLGEKQQQRREKFEKSHLRNKKSIDKAKSLLKNKF